MSDPTVRFTPGMNPRPVQSGEPMTTLVFDQELVGRLQALHRGGFSIRAEQVIAEHLAKVGQHRAGGRTPHEIKEYIWQQMQWGDAGVPAAAHADLHSLRRSVRANTEVVDTAGGLGTAPPTGQYPPHDPRSGPPQGAYPGPPPDAPPPGPDPDAAGGRVPEPDRGASVAGEILAWVPRALLVLAAYQLLRLARGFGEMPDASQWAPFRAIGDGVLEALNLNPDWSAHAANLTIPVLGLVLAGLLNYIPPLRRDRPLRTWPYVLLIAAWIALFALSGVLSFAEDATDTLRQSVQDEVDQAVEDQTDQVREDVEDAVDEQVGEITDDASGAAREAVDEQEQG